MEGFFFFQNETPPGKKIRVMFCGMPRMDGISGMTPQKIRAYSTGCLGWTGWPPPKMFSRTCLEFPERYSCAQEENKEGNLQFVDDSLHGI